MAIQLADFWRVEHKLLSVVIDDRVCEGCNGRWMKKLDDRVRRRMGPSITAAAPVHISSTQQRVLARWTIKVALLLMLWIHDECTKQPELLEALQKRDGRTDEPYVPLDDFRFVYRHQRPPDGVLIWIGRASDEFPDFTASLSALSRITTNPSRERVGYYVLFALRHLVVYVVLGLLDPETGIQGFDPDLLNPAKLSRIWPAAPQPVHWPPEQKLTMADVAQLTAADPGWAKNDPPP